MSKAITAFACIFVVLPLAANAADQIEVSPPISEPVIEYYNWTGFYIGAHGGYNWSKSKYNHVETDGVGGLATDIEAFNVSPSDWAGGFHAGYQHQFENFVIGVEGAYTFYDADERAFTDLNGFDRSRLTGIDDIWNVSAKAGYAWDRTLGYVKAGYASTEVHYVNRRLDTNEIVGRSEDRVGGFIVGAGFDHAITDNWILGLEYSFAKLDVDDQQQFDVDGDAVEAFNGSNKLSNHNVSLRLSYKF